MTVPPKKPEQTGAIPKHLPDKLTALYTGEEFLRAKAVELIMLDHQLSDDVELIHRTMDLIQHFVIEHVADDPEQETIQLLGIRLFNGLASSFRLLTSGYFQNAALILRDLLETSFLLSYLHLHPEKISTFRTGDEKINRKIFNPSDIRKALDKHDGFKERKRDAAYKLLCELAAHPTYKGFQMLAPKGKGAHCGPFIDQPTLKALIEEQVKIAVQVGQAFAVFFPATKLEAIEKKLLFMTRAANWLKRYADLP
ncbi:hypothetical protein [Pseudomonas sp. MWU318]|uniref:hypothetical protein n=1 Tax=Pseudomonas sp. MWU318 TaxID=2802569 RepID=UPI001926B8A5|nr:hypothetical protein [Pseudomonas sp. MWU318]